MINSEKKHEDKEANCCALNEKINLKHSDDDGHNHGDGDEHQSTFKEYLPATISFLLLVSGIILEQTNASFFHYPINLIWFAVAYIFCWVSGKFTSFQRNQKREFFL